MYVLIFWFLSLSVIVRGHFSGSNSRTKLFKKSLDQENVISRKFLHIEGGSTVNYVSAKSKLDEIVNNPENTDKLVVVDFTATWCGPCKMIAPFFEEMANEFSDTCIFLKVDVDEGTEIAQAYNVMSMPTFIFIKNGKIVERFSGASVEKLRQVIFAKI
jgi:thioredoxin 1